MKRIGPQVLECALAVALAPPRSDVTLRVLARWRAGQQGGRVPAPRRANRVRLAVAAAACAAIAAGAWLARPEPAMARASDVVQVRRAGERHARASERLASGDRLWAARPCDLTLADGTRVALAAHTVLAVAQRADRAVLHLLLGKVRIERAAPTPLLLDTNLGTIEIATGACEAVAVPRDYTLDVPALAEEMLMKELPRDAKTVLLTTTFLLTTGHARVLDGPHAGDVPPGRSLQDPKEAIDPRDRQLMLEVGEWDLEITDFVPGRSATGTTTRTYRGTEVCRAGPGREWLLSDVEFQRDGVKIEGHLVLGYDDVRLRYVGSFVDTFGGNMALVEGPAGDDVKKRVLETRGFRSDRADVARFTMRWIDDRQRHTTLETRDGEAWIKVREIVHVRR